MSAFDIFPGGGGRPTARVQAETAREALAAYATTIGIDPTVKRDSIGLTYVGDGKVGRWRARPAPAGQELRA